MAMPRPDVISDHCCYCGCEMWFRKRMTTREAKEHFGFLPGRSQTKKLKRRMATREHVVRLVDGGAKGKKNMIWACAYCNSHRQEREPFEHLVAMCRAVAFGEHPNHDNYNGD